MHRRWLPKGSGPPRTRRDVHASALVANAPASKIYSQARVGHALACFGREEKRLMTERGRESPDHGGMVRECGSGTS
jgi:hypothetical protein